jgi:hypothetical protein
MHIFPLGPTGKQGSAFEAQQARHGAMFLVFTQTWPHLLLQKYYKGSMIELTAPYLEEDYYWQPRFHVRISINVFK